MADWYSSRVDWWASNPKHPWQVPVINWESLRGVTAEDLNRIEGNILRAYQDTYGAENSHFDSGDNTGIPIGGTYLLQKKNVFRVYENSIHMYNPNTTQNSYFTDQGWVEGVDYKFEDVGEGVLFTNIDIFPLQYERLRLQCEFMDFAWQGGAVG